MGSLLRCSFKKEKSIRRGKFKKTSKLIFASSNNLGLLLKTRFKMIILNSQIKLKLQTHIKGTKTKRFLTINPFKLISPPNNNNSTIINNSKEVFKIKN